MKFEAASVDGKPCTKCGTHKRLDDFHRSSSASDGKASWCKKCVNSIRRDNRKRTYTPENKRKWQIKTAIRKIVWNLSDAPQQGENMNHKLDTDQQVFFYEQDFYVLSNFSAFRVKWQGIDFDTSEHAYHWEKFRDHPDAWNAAGSIAEQVRRAPSAHSAFKLAERCKPRRRPDWDDVKVKIMRGILKAKVDQHEYVRRKLLETGTRELVEDSWRDDFWGWGPNKDGKNMLGRLWMEIREELRAANQCGIAA